MASKPQPLEAPILTIIHLDKGQLRTSTRNPRKAKDPDVIKKLRTLIKGHGFQNPLQVYKEDKGMYSILCGNHRYEAAILEGMTTFPCIVYEGTREQADARAISDNKSSEWTEWDFPGLKDIIADLDTGAFDMDLLGFDAGELKDIFDHDLQAVQEDEVPGPPKDPITKLGDLWILGDHRVLCGDSTTVKDVTILLNGENPLLMVTDPPYGVEYDANWRNEVYRSDGKPYGGRAIGKVVNDNQSDWGKAYSLFPGDVAYIWHPAGAIQGVFIDSIERSGFDIRMTIIWAKNHFPIGRGHYHVKHEPCFYAVRKGRIAHWNGDRKQTTLWEIDKPTKSETGHSTQKPLECMARPIRNHHGNVYDPFLGSGTTLIAAHMLDRHCFGIEIDPGYCDVIVERWENLTGKKAERST